MIKILTNTFYYYNKIDGLSFRFIYRKAKDFSFELYNCPTKKWNFKVVELAPLFDLEVN